MALSEGEYVIIESLLKFCKWCARVVVIVAEYYFKSSKWVQALKILLLILELTEICTECGGTVSQETVEYSTQCPYQPACMGQYAWVVRTDGHWAECACECGEHWYKSF